MGAPCAARPWPARGGWLLALAADAQWIDRWRDTVYCERRHDPDDDPRPRFWGCYGLEAGPFLFFGEPALLGRIAEALDVPGPAGEDPD